MKPTIYLGLGGTGNLAISYTKRLYEEEFGVGNLPDSVAFVTVDFQTDMDADPNLATNISDNFIKIESAANPKEFYRVRSENEGEFSWMFKCNTRNIDNRISKGAKQVRTTGRLYTEMVLESIMSRLNATVNRVKFINNQADVAGGVNIHMVMSIAGGTGAGSFITIANAIRQKYGNMVNLFGYGVTHSVFRAMDISGTKTPNVELNAISSIIDLDYLMTAETNPIKLDMGMQKITLNESIFDGFFVVDNTSENGYVLTNISQISEVLGTCLYACGAEAGDTVAAAINNIGPKEGKHHVGAKLGWVQGLGACQVVYKGELLAQTYGLKAAIELIRKMRQEDANIQQDALNWTEEVGIREDGSEYNLLIDSIYPPANITKLKEPMLDVKSSDAANQDTLNGYLESLVNFPTQEILKKRTELLKTQLHEKIEKYLKAENGVGNSIKFLSSLKKLCEKYRYEMDEEAKTFTESKNNKRNVFDNKAFKNYNDEKYGKLTFHRDQKNQELLDEYVSRPAKEIVKDLHEAERREAARLIFVALLAEIDFISQSLKDLDQKLSNLSDDYENELSDKQRETSDALIFEYDLSYNERVNMTIDSNNIVVADFISTLGTSLDKIDIINDLDIKIKTYAESLPQAQGYRDRLINDVIDNLSNNEYNKLKAEIQNKSARWLNVNSRGQRVNSGERKAVEDAIAKSWIVSIYKSNDGYKSRLDLDDAFLPNVEGKQFLYVDKDLAKQKMIFCRIDGSVIPYCIGVFDDMAMNRYYTCINQVQGGDLVFNPHFDRHIFEKMREEDFKLKPEIKNEALLYWVCGQIFGSIMDDEGNISSIVENERIMKMDENNQPVTEEKKEQQPHTKYIYYKGKGGKKYVFYDSTAPAINREIDLGTTRDAAFMVFKRDIFPKCKTKLKEDIQKQYMPKIAFWEEKIREIARQGIHSYIDRIVCSDKSSVTYFNQKTEELNRLSEEFEYLKKELINQLANLK